METKKIKKLNVFGYELEENSCTAYSANIYEKRFMMHSKTSLNCIEIFKLLEESYETSFLETHDDKGRFEGNLIKIETDRYTIRILFPLKKVI